VIDGGKRGTQAIKDSWALTKNRFWPILGREIAAVIVFGFLLVAVSGVAFWIVTKLAGTGGYQAMVGTENQNPAVAGANILVNGIVQAAFIPLMYIFQVKLYLNLVKTK